jgi:hypothetical protein
MKTYPLYPYERGGKYLRPGNTGNTDEYIRNANELSLIEFLADEGCGSQLRVCGNYIDAHTHALYKCRNCDDERRNF